jgi:tetratricopeptide (TPR) repeat protein
MARLAGANLFRAIFTTNYDELIEDALKAQDIHYLPEVLELNFRLQQRKNLLVLKLHGSRTDWKSVILSGRSYDTFQTTYPLLSNQLDLTLRTHPLVFVGCSMSDPRVLDWLGKLPEAERRGLHPGRVLITRRDWGKLSDDQRVLLGSANIKPILVDSHADIAAVLAEVARKLAPLDPEELVFNLTPGKDSWTVVGSTPESAPHTSPNPLQDEALVAQLALLRELASRPVMIGTPGAAEQEAALDGLARTLGTRLTGVLLSEEARATVVRRLHAVDRGRARLSLRVHGGTDESDRALALPWELLMPEPGELAVRANKLAIVRDAVTEWSPLLQAPTAPLTLAVTIAAPEDQGSLRYEDEAFRLQRSLVPLGHAVAFADLGDVDDLVRVASGVSATALHFSGHGLPGALVFENELGFAEPIKVEDLVAKLRLNLVPSGKSGSFPKLFFLASCHGASGGGVAGSTSASDGCRSDGLENGRHARALDTAIGRGPSTAAALHRSGFVQVLGYFGPVSDGLSTRAEETFYGAVAIGKTTLQATAEARATLSEEIDLEGNRVRFPVAWTQLALYHRGPDHPPARPGMDTGAALPERLQRKTVEVSGLPSLALGFIGRRAMQHLLRRKVKAGQKLLVLQGLGGLGKTALASQLLSRVFAPDPPDALILTCGGLDPASADPATALWGQAEAHGRLHSPPDWDAAMKDLRERILDPAAGFEATVRLLRKARPKLVVYADNLETLQDGPKTGDAENLGTWLPGARSCWEALERLAEGGLVMASTRYAWANLDPDAWVPIEPMRPADVLRMIETYKHLGRLPRAVQNRIAEHVDGHPRTVEYLDTLVGKQRQFLGQSFEEKDHWAKLIEPVLPTNTEQITTYLLLDAVWTRLSNGARAHARTLTVLRVPAPWKVIEELGSAATTTELSRAGMLTRFREQALEDGTLKWVDRWGMHSLVAGFAGKDVEAKARLEAHRAAGVAYDAWVEQPGARWSEQVEGITHLHAASEGDRAWPMVKQYVLWLRDKARYREALQWLVRCEAAGTTGERLACALTLLCQMRIHLGQRSSDMGAILDRALNLAESDDMKGAVLHEHGSLLQKQGKYPEAETLLRNALALNEKALGAAHPSYGASQHALAVVLAQQGKYPEAEMLLRNALAVLTLTEKAVGVAHPNYGSSQHVLAVVLKEQGKYPEAETLLRNALAIDEKALGVAHPDYGSSQHALALVLKEQGKYPEAETLLRNALAIHEKALGVAHPDYGSSQLSLAVVLAEQGKYPEAETLLRNALALTEKALGRDHPALCATAMNLGVVLAQQGRTAEAEPFVHRALAIAQAVHGPRHPDTAQILNILAQLQAVLGKSEARDTARQALDALTQSLGPDHPVTKSVAPTLQQIAAGIASKPGQQGPGADLAAKIQEAMRALAAGDPLRAIDLLTAAADRAREAGFSPLEASACGLLAQALFLIGCRDEALPPARRALEIAEAVEDQGAIKHFRELLDHLEPARESSTPP